MNSPTVFVTQTRTRATSGTRLNDVYEIDELIAVGGMGEVFRGHNIETGDTVAIKTIRPDFAENTNALALFRKEAAALHTVHHGAVVRYYVFSVERRLDLPYLAMEFVTGESLADRLKRGPLPFEAVEILRRRLAGGLQAAHEAGIVHRDISPDNVILPEGDPARAKIIDFGIARSLTGKTVIGDSFAGKYAYVSPEQLGLQGGDVNARSDIYSLGLVLAEASRGRPLDMGGTMAEFVKRRSVVPDLDGVDARLLPLLASMLQPSPLRRVGSMAEVEAWHPKSQRDSGTPRSSRLGRRLTLGGALVGITALAGAIAFALLPPSRLPDTGYELPQHRPIKPSGPSPAEQHAPDLTEKQTVPVQPPAPGGTDRFDPDSDSGPPNRPNPPKESTPSRQPPVPETPPSAPGPGLPPQGPDPGSSAMEQVVTYIRDYSGGTCFFLNPTVVGAREAAVEGFGMNAQPFVAFDAAFKERFGFEAKIQLRQTERGQCPVVEALAAQARAMPASVPKLKLQDDRIRSGGELRGTVEFGDSRSVRLFLVEGNGQVHDLDPYLRRDGRQTAFTIRLEKSNNEGWRPYLIVAVGSRDTLTFAGGEDRRSEAAFQAISRAAARPGSSVGLAVQYVKVGS